MKTFSFTRCTALVLAFWLGEALIGIVQPQFLHTAFSQPSRPRPISPRVSSRPLPPQSQRVSGNPRTWLADAQRSLKIGSSYREARNYDLAQKYIQRGIELAQKAGNRYWEATGYEYLGLVYRDIGDRTAALSALQRASDIFNGLIKQPDGSQRATQALIDDVNRNDRSRPPANLAPSPMNQGAPPSQAQPYRSIPPPTGSARPYMAAPAPSSDLERERNLNRQLTERVLALENKIRALEDRSIPSPGGTVTYAPSTPSAAATESSPGVIARTMPRQVPDGGKPQAEFSPFQTDKKPRPEPITRSTSNTARSVVTDVYTLPTFTLQIGIGAGYNLNTRGLITQRTVSGSTTTENVYGNAPPISFPLLTVSGDFFITPNFSIGLMYGYYPGLDTALKTITSGTSDTVTRVTTISYHTLMLRPVYHFVRDRYVDVYAGLSIGALINFNPFFSPLSLYGGVLVGGQYNFTRQVGVFLELSGGATFLGSTPLQQTPTGDLLIGIGAYGRLGLAINF
ncbi:MAG: tetratricopeptide repeat protein [Candidatus Kapabacteria bacterium]|jgi:hypothetical protein|nr:tetratricopeptide repeat protein [Candidatus Kapabacteria bacterium]